MSHLKLGYCVKCPHPKTLKKVCIDWLECFECYYDNKPEIITVIRHRNQTYISDKRWFN